MKYSNHVTIQMQLNQDSHLKNELPQAGLKTHDIMHSTQIHVHIILRGVATSNIIPARGSDGRLNILRTTYSDMYSV